MILYTSFTLYSKQHLYLSIMIYTLWSTHLEVREELYRSSLLVRQAVLRLETHWFDKCHLGTGGDVHHGVMLTVLWQDINNNQRLKYSAQHFLT